MPTFHGTSKHPGVAIAVAVGVDLNGGLPGLPDEVVRQGLRAVKMNLPEADQPEVIVACDLLAIGSAVRVPGVRTAGIAAQMNDQPAVPVHVPCVAGIGDFLRSVGSGQIAIVDGDEGVVCLEPDAQTIARYQEALAPKPAGRVFLESAHIPARTQDGRVVTVAAVVSSLSEADVAISQGADALIVDLPRLVKHEIEDGWVASSDPQVELLQTLVALAAGKPLVLRQAQDAARPSRRLRRAVREAGQAEITFSNPADSPEPLSEVQVRTAVSSGAAQVAVPADAVAETKELIRTLPDDEVQA